jgi:hypothetical protein
LLRPYAANPGSRILADFGCKRQSSLGDELSRGKVHFGGSGSYGLLVSLGQAKQYRVALHDSGDIGIADCG